MIIILSRGHTKESAFEKSFGVCKETLLHGSYADYIKEYAARSTRASGPVNSDILMLLTLSFFNRHHL